MICAPVQLAAQGATAREIVQPLPSSEVQRLNRALMELARRPQAVGALIEAGNASLAVRDFDAAIGFFGRAREMAPADQRVTLGLARVYLRSGRPLEALPRFLAARAQGASESDFLTDQALTYDLIGDQSSAQPLYQRALELDPQDDEARRRLAISHAINGNEAQFESVLAPLLADQNNAAMRSRAFGLAILGKQDSAAAIVDASMPRDLASRINPYLAYMPRLTAAQQAAAANLGIFPRVADIGRDDPRLARFVEEGEVGSLLEPAGEPLGAPTQAEATDAPDSEVAQTALAIVQPVPEPAPESPPEPEPELAPEPEPEPQSVSDAFADLGTGDLPVAGQTADAVDIGAIEAPREAPPPAEPAEPEHPRRIWVQLATGRDVSALGFDWRRFARRAPELLGDFEPHVTAWGQSNRLLAGPVSSRAQARSLVNALAQKGLNTFAYTSPEGTEIQQLNR